jgi:short-subunit dehydrogenase
VNLAGRTVLLTGATGGLGHAIARRLYAERARLVLTGRRTEVLEPLAAETGAQAVAVDLADLAAVERLANDHAEVDVLVANAGLSASGHVLSFSVEEIDRALAVNLRAPMVLARALSAGMVARGRGHLVFVGSLQAKAPSPLTSVYSATKAGLRAFATGLREDLRDTGVGVSSVFPGFIRDAGMFHDAGGQLPGYVATRSPEDVAAGVVRAIERNRAEVSVAPVSLRAGASLTSLIPEVSGRVQRRLGSMEIAEETVKNQRDKR